MFFSSSLEEEFSCVADDGSISVVADKILAAYYELHPLSTRNRRGVGEDPLGTHAAAKCKQKKGGDGEHPAAAPWKLILDTCMHVV